MAPLVVDPGPMFAAGSAVVAAGDGVAANLTVLVAGFAANTGLDMAGEMFRAAYCCSADARDLGADLGQGLINLPCAQRFEVAFRRPAHPRAMIEKYLFGRFCHRWRS